jgi:hypothetical protein
LGLVRAVLGAGFAHVDTGFVQREVWWLVFVLCPGLCIRRFPLTSV